MSKLDVDIPQLLPYERLQRTGTMREWREATARPEEAEPTSHLHKGSMNVLGQGSYRVKGSDRRTWGMADSRTNKPAGEQRWGWTV